MRFIIIAVLGLGIVAFTWWWNRREGHFIESEGQFSPADLGLKRRSPRATTIVEFFGEGCAPCVTVRKRLDEVAEALPEVRVVTIDAGERMDLASKFEVRRVPTVFVTDEDLHVRWRASGVPTNEDLMGVLLGPDWAGRPNPDQVSDLL